MIDIADIRSRYRQSEEFLDERGRRLFAANEALALGHGGVTATAKATSLARSTINRGIRELRSGSNDIGRPGAPSWRRSQERGGASTRFAGGT